MPKGDSLAVPKILSRSNHKLLLAHVAIRQEPEAAEKTYMVKQLIQCTLPHRNPGNVPVWTRRNGDLRLSVKPYIDSSTGLSIGFPYGSIPRLLMFWMVTEAIRTKDRTLQLGDTLAEFMREVGLNPDTGGGKRGDAARLKNQMMRLFRSTISFERTLGRPQAMGRPQASGMGWLDMQVAPHGEFWWDEKSPEQPALWGSWIRLGEDFYNAIRHVPVPCDFRALRALKQSPTALDLYALLNYLGATVQKPHFIAWWMFQQQLGSEVEQVDNFRRKLLAALCKVQLVMPGIKVEQVEGGLKLYPGRPAIARRSE